MTETTGARTAPATPTDRLALAAAYRADAASWRAMAAMVVQRPDRPATVEFAYVADVRTCYLNLAQAAEQAAWSVEYAPVAS